MYYYFTKSQSELSVILSPSALLSNDLHSRCGDGSACYFSELDDLMIPRAMKDTQDGVQVRNALRQRGFTTREIGMRAQMLEECFNFK